MGKFHTYDRYLTIPPSKVKYLPLPYFILLRKSEILSKSLGQYDRPRVLEPVDGVLVVLISNQINIATFVHQMGDTQICHLVNKRSNIELIWTTNYQYPLYWFAYMYSRYVILAQVLYVNSNDVYLAFSPNEIEAEWTMETSIKDAGKYMV